MLIKFEVNMKLSVICLLSLLFERLEQVLDAVRGECRLTKDTHDFEDWPADSKVMLDEGNEVVGDDGNMNLDAELKKWHTNRNNRQKGMDWQFTNEEARVILKHLYPLVNF